jgi:hypothetical protein
VGITGATVIPEGAGGVGDGLVGKILEGRHRQPMLTITRMTTVAYLKLGFGSMSSIFFSFARL